MSDLTLREIVQEEYPELMVIDGYDDCILGISHRFGMDAVIAYDMNKVIEKLSADGMNIEEAQEFFNYNIIGQWIGDHTPVYIEQITT